MKPHRFDPAAEQNRLKEELQYRSQNGLWRKWGPYLSERQWGTVREDYSANGNAWEYVSHDAARSRAYRWGEDGIGGFCDHHQRLCFGLALWNGVDPILKERLFGLTNSEGNHGEDCKELYYYLDALPSNAYLKMLYKYPQRSFPYADLVHENRARSRNDPEYELLDTGIFDDNRYFDVFIEYAKPDPNSVCILITAHNRGPEPATLHLIPQLWFRNTWSWKPGSIEPRLAHNDARSIRIHHESLGEYELYAAYKAEWLFTDNETNTRRLYQQETPGYFKDAFHEYLIHGDKSAINPSGHGTKAGAYIKQIISPGTSIQLALTLAPAASSIPKDNIHDIIDLRRKEADAYYQDLQRDLSNEDARLVQRQAFAGMLWSKQYFYYDIPEWLNGDANQPPPPAQRLHGRNFEWKHLNNADIISMPDKWEYPWYAAWDLAFHTVAFALIEPEFAKSQLLLMTREWYMHPNGQLPAYEWAFGDVNPPVHAWASWRVFQMDRTKRGDAGDLEFLEKVFHKLMLNFTWWVNRKDTEGRNIFQGGFLGLDNIGVFDRSAPLPTGGHINQADGTSWMAMFSLNLMRIALELAQHNHVYEDIATKFFEHFLHIAEAMNNIGECGIGLWNEEDAFFYDVLNLPGNHMIPLKVRSMVGLIPLFAVEVLEPDLLEHTPQFAERLRWFLNYRPDLARLVSRWQDPGRGERRLLSLLRGHRMKCLLQRMLDETEFLSPHGVRALSKFHETHPYVFRSENNEIAVRYLPGESDSGLFGGNSNWRGPIWMPVNYLLIESLQKFHHYYGDDFKIECPTGSGTYLTIQEVANELAARLTRLFLRNENGKRTVFHNNERIQNDPHFRDYLLFYEYFDGDTGRGLGASHQTGWTGLIANLLKPDQGGLLL